MINLSHLINQTLIECGKRPMRLEKIKSIKMLNLMISGGIRGEWLRREKEERNENLLEPFEEKLERDIGNQQNSDAVSV